MLKIMLFLTGNSHNAILVQRQTAQINKLQGNHGVKKRSRWASSEMKGWARYWEDRIPFK